MRKKVPIFLYSGKYQKIITDILVKFDKEDPESLEICTHNIRQLYNSNIKDFLERNDYPSTLVGFFRNQEVTKEDVLVEKLREYPELLFKSCFPRFDGKILPNKESYTQTINEIQELPPDSIIFFLGHGASHCLYGACDEQFERIPFIDKSNIDALTSKSIFALSLSIFGVSIQ